MVLEKKKIIYIYIYIYLEGKRTLFPPWSGEIFAFW